MHASKNPSSPQVNEAAATAEHRKQRLGALALTNVLAALGLGAVNRLYPAAPEKTRWLSWRSLGALHGVLGGAFALAYFSQPDKEKDQEVQPSAAPHPAAETADAPSPHHAERLTHQRRQDHSPERR